MRPFLCVKSSVRNFQRTKMFSFEGNGGNKSLPAREGTLDKVLRGRNRDDHHQSRTVGAINKTNLPCMIIHDHVMRTGAFFGPKL